MKLIRTRIGDTEAHSQSMGKPRFANQSSVEESDQASLSFLFFFQTSFRAFPLSWLISYWASRTKVPNVRQEHRTDEGERTRTGLKLHLSTVFICPAFAHNRVWIYILFQNFAVSLPKPKSENDKCFTLSWSHRSRLIYRKEKYEKKHDREPSSIPWTSWTRTQHTQKVAKMRLDLDEVFNTQAQAQAYVTSTLIQCNSLHCSAG